MSLRNRGGVWHYRFKVKGQSYAQSTGLSATRPNENAAKAIEAQARLAARAGSAAKPAKPVKPITFAEAGIEFLTWCDTTQYRNKPSTARRIRTSFASLTHFLGEFAVSSIAAIHIERYKTWRAENDIKDVTLRHDLDNLSLFLSYAIKAGWRESNPLKGEGKVSRPSTEHATRINVLTPEDERRYFAAIKHPTPPRRSNLYDLARLILLQGMRPEEVSALQKEDLDVSDGSIKIRKGKRRASKRTIYLQSESLAILEARLALTPESPWLFPSRRRAGDHIRKLNNTHELACTNAGVSFVPYDLRHTFATRFMEDGGDLPTLAAILGHSGLRDVAKYVHMGAAHQRAAMQRFERGGQA